MLCYVTYVTTGGFDFDRDRVVAPHGWTDTNSHNKSNVQADTHSDKNEQQKNGIELPNQELEADPALCPRIDLAGSFDKEVERCLNERLRARGELSNDWAAGTARMISRVNSASDSISSRISINTSAEKGTVLCAECFHRSSESVTKIFPRPLRNDVRPRVLH